MIAFTKEQLSEVMCKHAEKENGFQDLMEIMLESLMVAERGEFLREGGRPWPVNGRGPQGVNCSVWDGGGDILGLTASV